MSAFYVGNVQVSKIANAIALKKELNDKDRKELAKNLHFLNVKALIARYPKSYKPMIEKWQYSGEIFVSKYQLYKSLRCFLYQCSEGEVPKMNLFKEVVAFCDDLAHEITMDLANKKGALWE